MAFTLLLSVVALTEGANYPPFSWDTVPIFQQLCRKNATLDTPFSKDQLAFLEKYPIVVLEHCTGYNEVESNPNVWMEDEFIAAAKMIKANTALDTPPTVYAYNNENAALPWYRFTQAALRDPSKKSFFVLDKSGQPEPFHGGGHMLPNATIYTYEQSDDWVDFYSGFCANVTASGDVDGVFIDTASNAKEPYQINVLLELTKKCPGKVVGVHAPSILGVNATENVPQLYQPYTFGKAPGSDLKALQQWGKEGRIFLAHTQNPAGTVNQSKDILPPLSLFLIGAQEHAYYAYSENPGLSDFCTGELPTWCSGMGVSEYFSKPLGEPLGQATKSSNTYTREFKKGTKVTVEMESSKQSDKIVACSISWGDGSVSTCTL
eukprot:m.39742 g.39742  ORF g.39742 m.39742 type:complete len:377 (+) comp9586_c0_seq1:1-1131(+)